MANEHTFGRYMLQARESRGWGAPELGRRLGISDKQVYRYEKGINEPSLAIAARLADVLDVSLDEVVGRATPPRDGGSEAVVLPLSEYRPAANAGPVPPLTVEVRLGRRRFVASTEPPPEEPEPAPPKRERRPVDVEASAEAFGKRAERRQRPRRRQVS